MSDPGNRSDENLSSTEDLRLRRKQEWRLFLFIVVLLFPLLSVALVGTYGFSIWMYQLIAGPPGVG